MSQEDATNKVLEFLGKELLIHEKDLKSCGLPEPVQMTAMKIDAVLINNQLKYNKEKEKEKVLQIMKMMTTEQINFFRDVLEAINSNSKQVMFFVDAPGGTGKTFVMSAIMSAVRSDGFIALATALSASAAKHLPGGTTLHSCMKVPINIQEDSLCSFTKNSATAKLLQDKRTKLLVIDEVSMGGR